MRRCDRNRVPNGINEALIEKDLGKMRAVLRSQPVYDPGKHQDKRADGNKYGDSMLLRYPAGEEAKENGGNDWLHDLSARIGA